MQFAPFLTDSNSKLPLLAWSKAVGRWSCSQALVFPMPFT